MPFLLDDIKLVVVVYRIVLKQKDLKVIAATIKFNFV